MLFWLHDLQNINIIHFLRRFAIVLKPFMRNSTKTIKCYRTVLTFIVLNFVNRKLITQLLFQFITSLFIGRQLWHRSYMHTKAKQYLKYRGTYGLCLDNRSINANIITP